MNYMRQLLISALLAGNASVVWAGVPYHEVAYQNLPGADFKPGALRLPLTVHERSGVERKGIVVTSGAPFPPGFLHDVGKLAVVDKEGTAVVCQAVTMLQWHKPAYDDSVQWALVSFAADVPPAGTATYYLTDDGTTPAPASALRVRKTDADLTVDTGAASFVIPLRGEALLARASIGSAEVIGGAGLRGIVTSGDWPDRNLKAGDKLTATHDAAGVTVEESGPARVVVCIKGSHAPGDKDGKFYGFTARLYFSAPSAAVRIIYTIRNGAVACVWPIKDASLVAELALGPNVAVSTLAEGKLVGQAVAAEPLKVCQDSFAGYKVTLGDKELAAGVQHSGVLDSASGGRGLSVARRNFRAEWPGALSTSARELRLGLFPGESSGPFHLEHGIRRSWDIRLTLHGEKATDLQGCFAEQDALLLFRPDPAWMVRAAGLTGSRSAGLSLAKNADKPAPLRRQPGKMESGSNGWDRFGVIGSWNAGGAHWNEQTAFLNWVIRGNGAEFDSAEVHTLWAADQCPSHFDSSAEHSRLKVLTYPGYRNRATWGRPDTGHMGMWMWPEYYMLTGDARCREAVCSLGEMGRADLWRFIHDGKNGGRKRDPDAEPDFKLDTRYRAWPLYCLSQYYQFTGDPELLEEAGIAARAFRNTARACPIGQLVKDAAGKDGTEPTEYSGNITRGWDGVQSQVRECKRSASLVASNFYSGITIFALREHYLVSRDVETLDTLVGQIDRFCHYSLVRTPEGKPAGWTYIFGDYWGPYTWEDSVKGGKPGAYMNSANLVTCDAIARIYPLTGRGDLMEVLEAADKVNRGNIGAAALAMAVAHPKADQTSPAPIKDLAAEALVGGKVRLTWTAPGGSGDKGQAAWYQVKWSTAKIVERVSGWPDRTEPLPATRKDWLERATAFNARQRSFWAAYNVPGVPSPAPAGTRESLVVGGLPAGTVYLAIKAWNAADNMSELSNVVTVDVK